ncbi:hypothetical protein [Halanaerocella petrolearia]
MISLKTISIIAGIIFGFVGMIIGIITLIIKIKEYISNKKVKEKQKPDLDLNIENLFAKNMDDFKIYAVRLAISNPKDIDNSIQDIHLLISCKKRQGVDSVLKLDHKIELKNFLENNDINVLKSSDEIPAHNNISGWVFFKVNKELLEDYIIDFYNILITDVHGLENKIEPIIFKEGVDETKLE